MAQGGGGVGGFFAFFGKIFTFAFSSRKALIITSTAMFFFILTAYAIQESIREQSFNPFLKRVGGAVFFPDKELSENITKYKGTTGGVFNNKLLVMSIFASLYFLLVFVFLVFKLFKLFLAGSVPEPNLFLLALLITAFLQIIYSLFAYQELYVPFKGFGQFFWDFIFEIDWGAIYRVIVKLKNIDVPGV